MQSIQTRSAWLNSIALQMVEGLPPGHEPRSPLPTCGVNGVWHCGSGIEHPRSAGVAAGTRSFAAWLEHHFPCYPQSVPSRGSAGRGAAAICGVQSLLSGLAAPAPQGVTVVTHKMGILLLLLATSLLGFAAPASAASGCVVGRGSNLPGVDLSGCDLSYRDLTGANLQGANLSNANLRGATLFRVNLTDANVASANLMDADLSYASLARANVTGSTTVNLKLIGATANGASFAGHGGSVDAQGASLVGADLRGYGTWSLNAANAHAADFSPIDGKRSEAVGDGVNLSGANMSDMTYVGVRNSNLRGADLHSPTDSYASVFYVSGFVDSDLSGANLAWATLRTSGVNLANSNVDGATFVEIESVSSGGLVGVPRQIAAGWTVDHGYLLGPSANLTGANLANSYLENVNLSNATLTGASSGGISGRPASLPSSWRLSGGYLLGPGANLVGANLAGLDLRYVRLTMADLRRATLSRTNLSFADLVHATLAGANVTGARFTGVDLTETGASGLVGRPAAMPAGWGVYSAHFASAPWAPKRFWRATRSLPGSRISLTIHWAPAGWDGGAPTTRYRLFVNGRLAAVVPPNRLSFTFVLPKSNPHVQVAAENAIGVGQPTPW